MEIKEILNQIGYTSLQDCGDYWRCKPLYRNSNNATSLRIRKLDGQFNDFSTHENGSLAKLISLTNNISLKDASKMVDNGQIESFVEYKEPLKFDKPIDLSEMTLLPSYNFYLKRGIEKEVLETLGAKLCMSGKMVRRIVFPIYNEKGSVIGLDGRTVIDAPIKWKKLGFKSKWVYPLCSIPYIKKNKEVILVEGISDIVALMNAGVNNCFSLFGTALSPILLAKLLSLNPNRIFISTNNEPDNESIGNNAALEIQKKLLKFFPKEVICIKLPPKKDFGEMSKKEIQLWKIN